MPAYDGPVVDAHHHFWDPAVNHHPWLMPDARIPFRYGDYEAIKRRYLPDDYRQDATGQNIVQTVYVETEWDPADPIGETRYASGLAARHGWPNAIVAQAWLDQPDAADLLAAQARFPLVRSVRHKPGGPAVPGDAGLTLMSDAAWRRGFAALAPNGLHFDLQTPWWNLHEAIELAQDFPGTTIILNHAGLPAQRDPTGLRGWQAAMAAFALCPNVAVKLSGMGVPGQPWHTESAAWIVRTAIELFGAQRAMFGSNFPVDSLCASFSELLLGFRTIVQPMPAAEQAAFFHDTAKRIYRPHMRAEIGNDRGVCDRIDQEKVLLVMPDNPAGTDDRREARMSESATLPASLLLLEPATGLTDDARRAGPDIVAAEAEHVRHSSQDVSVAGSP